MAFHYEGSHRFIELMRLALVPPSSFYCSRHLRVSPELRMLLPFSESIIVVWVISSSPWAFLAPSSHLAHAIQASAPKESLPLHLLHTVTVDALLSIEAIQQALPVYFRLGFWC